MTKDLSPQDRKMVKRLVGYWEYLNALTNLDRLLPQLDETQRDQLDEYVRRRREYSVNPVELGNANRLTGKKADEERIGLPWVLALARVELAAMLAGFTDVPNPYHAVRVTEYDLPAYKELLREGTRSHLMALKRDTNLQTLAETEDVVPILAYGRRLLIARGMLRAAGQAAASELGSDEARELYGYDDLLGKQQRELHRYLTNLTRDFHAQSSRSSTDSEERILSTYCAPIARGLANEIRRGTAQTFTYPQATATPPGSSSP